MTSLTPNHWTPLREANEELRKNTQHYERTTVTTSTDHFTQTPSIQRGDVLIKTGQTVTAVFSSIWDPVVSQRVELNTGYPRPYCLVALEGGQCHGLTLLTGEIEVFRPVLTTE